MSIIYGTLERLEADNPPRPIDTDGVDPPRLAPEPKGLSVKLWATALAVVIAGTSVMLWPRGDGAGILREFVPVDSVVQSSVVETPRQQPSQVAAGEPVTATLESTGPNGDLSRQDEVVPAVQTPTGETAVTAERRVAASKKVSRQPDLEEATVVAEATAGITGPASAESRAAAVEPDVGKATSAPGQVRAVAVDKVIEQARLALSRGQYPQALSTLEQLEPVPNKRADFWLIKGSAHLGMGQLDPAGAAFASAQALAPHNAQIAVQQAIIKQEQGDHAGALEILESAATRHPDVPEICLNQGYSQLALGAVREAKRSFRAFLNMTEGRSLYLQQRNTVKEWLAQVSSPAEQA